MDEIQSKSYDGFIAFTDGGWDAVATFAFNSDTTNCVELLADSVTSDSMMMVEEFRREYGEEMTDDEMYEHPDYEDFTSEWYCNDTTIWFVKARALFYKANNYRNTSGEDEYLFCFGVNDDFDYGRDDISWCKGVGTHWSFERNVPVSDITPELLSEIKTQMFVTWQAA